MKRRNFLQTVPLIGAGALLSNGVSATEKETAITNHREYWIGLMDQLAGPLLKAGSKRKLKSSMPVETTTGAKEKPSTYLEGVGRLLAGMAPWLELEPGNSNETKLRKGYRKQALETISGIVDPKSPDYLFDHMEPQMLVDAAFLAHAFLRAPKQL